MKPVAFDYLRAASLDDVTAALGEAGPDAVLLAGGMSLGPMLNMRLVRPSLVIDLGQVDELRAVTGEGDEVRVGATARQADVMRDGMLADTVPLLAMALPHVGHYQTRSRGTVGGSIAHADPSAEIPLCLLTLDGAVELASARSRRRVQAVDFFNGILSTARAADEVLTASFWPRRRERSGHAFAEFAQRHGDFAIAAAACAVELREDGTFESLTVGLGGVEDRPIRAETPEIAGRDIEPDLIEQVAESIAGSIAPLEDMAASAEYRRALARHLSTQVMTEAVDAARRELVA